MLTDEMLDKATAAAVAVIRSINPETAEWADWPAEDQAECRTMISAALAEAIDTNRSLHRRVQRAEGKADKRCTALRRERDRYDQLYREEAKKAVIWHASAAAASRAYTELRNRGFWARVFG